MDHHSLSTRLQAQDQKISQLEQENRAKGKAYEELFQRFKKLDVNKTRNSKAKTKSTATTPRQKSKPTPVSKKSSNKATPSPSPKRNPNQMMMKDLPAEFRHTKESLYCFIRIIWGMYHIGAVPPPPDIESIREFYGAFLSPDQVQNVILSTSARDLIPKHQVLTLRNVEAGRKNMKTGIINFQQFFLDLTKATLAKIGIRAWGPNLDEPIDSLWNVACRLSALQIYRQVAIGGAFAFMNINKNYIEDYGLMETTYNHFVHYLMAEKFKKERKEEGKNAKDEQKKVVQKARRRLKDSRYKYGFMNNFPDRYKKILSNIDAHSDDEYSSTADRYIIKTLPFRLQKANQFFRRLDEEILKSQQLEGRRTQRRIRILPKNPSKSTISRPPRNLPLDFYDSSWFNELSAPQKNAIADTRNVAFLPNASKSLKSLVFPEERLSDKKFTSKYWDSETQAYNLDYEMASDDDSDDGSSDSSDDLGVSHCGGSVSLDEDASSNGCDEREDIKGLDEDEEMEDLGWDRDEFNAEDNARDERFLANEWEDEYL